MEIPFDLSEMQDAAGLPEPEILNAIAACKIQILTQWPNAKNIRGTHNSYCYGLFWDGTSYGMGNAEFEPLQARAFKS